MITPAVISPVYIPGKAAGFVQRDVGGLIIDKEQQQALKGPSYTLDISHSEYRSSFVYLFFWFVCFLVKTPVRFFFSLALSFSFSLS